MGEVCMGPIHAVLTGGAAALIHPPYQFVSLLEDTSVLLQPKCPLDGWVCGEWRETLVGKLAGIEGLQVQGADMEEELCRFKNCR